MQGIEQELQQAVQQLAAMQVQQAQTEQQLREARERQRRRPRQRQGKESEQAKVVSQGAQAAVAPMGLESIHACLVDLTPSTDPSPNGVIGARR